MEIFLKAHRDVGCVASLATVFWDLFGSIKKMLVHRKRIIVIYNHYFLFSDFIWLKDHQPEN
jgi:hypothetical protein